MCSTHYTSVHCCIVQRPPLRHTWSLISIPEILSRSSLLQSRLTNTPRAQPFLCCTFLCCNTELFKVPAHLNPVIKYRSRANGEIAALQRGPASRTAPQGSSWPALASRSSSPLDRHHPCRSSSFLFQGSPIPPNSSESALVRYDARYQMPSAHDAGPSPSPPVPVVAWARCVRVCVCAREP